MLSPTVVPGANYGEYWPDGAGATSLTLPPGLTAALLYFRVAQDGRISGQSQTPGTAQYWDGHNWRDLGTSTGVSVTAFHPVSGEVYVSDGAGVRVYSREAVYSHTIPGYIGSQGIRWIQPDGSVVSGDATYGLPGRLGEYYQFGDVYIGQGLAGGVDAIVDGLTRHLCDGVAQFLRVTNVGDAFALYWTDFAAGYQLFTSLTELRALPPVTPPEPEPTPPDPEPEPEPPQPEPEPEPEPEPPEPEPPIPPDPVPTPVGGDMLAGYGNKPLPGFHPGEDVDNGNGTISVKKPNGKFLCVTPEGDVQERDDPGGPWESFLKGRGCLIAQRDGGDKGPLVYVLPAAETDS